MRRQLLAGLLLFLSCGASGGERPGYKDLPGGKYAVGFKIVTVTDSTRVAKTEYNYFGEKNIDRFRKITMQLWYPAENSSGKRSVTYGDYCYNSLLTATHEVISGEKKNELIIQWRNSMERFFGKVSDNQWAELIAREMLAKEDAAELPGNFPLLIGLMRPFTTAITNEFLASHGYTVAMIKKEEPGDDDWAKNARYEIPDMQFVISHLAKGGNFERNNIGAFGFSGAGFVPVLFAMHDSRVKALADLESFMYFDKDSLFQLFSRSDYYDPVSLRVPFLHIFGNESARLEKFFSEFHNKTKFSTRYRLLLDQPGFSHGDLTMQGYVFRSALVTSKSQQNIRKSFELANIYLLNFFNAQLKSDLTSKAFLSSKPILPEYPPELWDITVFDAVKPAPNSAEFEFIIRKKGIEEALEIVKNTLKDDSSSNLLKGSVLNNLGYKFLIEQKYPEAIGLFKLNTGLHPHDPNLFDSLAEGYELSGDRENMRSASRIVMAILGKKDNLSDAEKGLKASAEKRLNN